jgi:hypothetical protein
MVMHHGWPTRRGKDPDGRHGSQHHWRITRRAIGRPSMEVPTGSGHRGVSEGGLDQVDRRTALERVGGMGVAEPMW